jgi:hypothetical protein
MNFHADFDVVKETPDFILIKDTGHMTGKSVTSDAEYVVARLVEEHGIGGRRVFYVDSLGETDELTHEGGQFTGFKFGHEGVEL